MDQNRLELDLRTHEVQCEERWKTTFVRLENIEDTLGRMEGRFYALGGTIILFLAGVIVTLSTMQ